MRKPLNVLLTGGTGFLGEYLLAELLEQGHSVWVLYRSEARKLDTIRFLSILGLPRSAKKLHWFMGDILEVDRQWDTWCRENEGLEEVDTLLHNAASTRLHIDATGEPLRTNVGSARALRRLVDRNPLKVHIISTAYVAGLVQGKILMEVNHPRGDFVNVYEESKWEAEQLWSGAATLLRPSIIVGHSDTGRCTSFSGWYILFQAAHLLDRLICDAAEDNRSDLRIDLPADPKAAMNIVPVDYVARAAVRIVENPANHNRIFHLTHPDPPNHEYTLDYACRRFNFSGMRLVGTGAPFSRPRSRIERMVRRQIQTILFHFSNNPIFDRTNTDRALPHLKAPVITDELLDRLIDYAIERDWGNREG